MPITVRRVLKKYGITDETIIALIISELHTAWSPELSQTVNDADASRLLSLFLGVADWANSDTEPEPFDVPPAP